MFIEDKWFKMGYHQKVMFANQLIDKMYKEGVSFNKIWMKISNSFGFGRLFVERRIGQIEDLLEELEQEEEKIKVEDGKKKK